MEKCLTKSINLNSRNFNYLLCLFYVYNLSLTTCIGVGLNNNSSQSPNHKNVSANISDAQDSILQNRSASVASYSSARKDEIPPTRIPTNNSENNSNNTKSKGVWCYCNFPQCVPNGYMCQSVEGKACFSKKSAHHQPASISTHLSSGNVFHHVATDPLVRGCVELLPDSDKLSCFKMLGRTGAPATDSDHRLNGGRRRRPLLKGLEAETHRPLNGLQCCNQNVCNYEKAKPIIIREIDGSDSPLSRSVWWLKGVTIGVSIIGVVVLVFLFIFAGRILTSDEKGRSSEFLQQPNARDLYIKVPYYIERTSNIPPTEGEECSVLCVKSLQKNLQKKQDVADYCRFHPLFSSSNRHSLSCPSSLASCPTTSYQEYGNKEEREPLTDDVSEETTNGKGGVEKEEVLFRSDQLATDIFAKS